MVRKSPSPREVSPKLLGSFHPSCDFATFELAGWAPEAFLATWYFSGLFWQTRRPEMPLQCNCVAKKYHSGSRNSRPCVCTSKESVRSFVRTRWPAACRSSQLPLSSTVYSRADWLKQSITLFCLTTATSYAFQQIWSYFCRLHIHIKV